MNKQAQSHQWRENWWLRSGMYPEVGFKKGPRASEGFNFKVYLGMKCVLNMYNYA